jgi:hypothetical protein
VKHAFQVARTYCHRNAFRMARNIEYAPLGSSSILFFIAIGTTTVVFGRWIAKDGARVLHFSGSDVTQASQDRSRKH